MLATVTPPEPPAPRISVVLSAIVVAPSVMRPEPAASVLFPPMPVALFKLIALFVAVIVPLIAFEPAVWTTPAVKVMLSPASLPMSRMPVLVKFVAAMIVVACANPVLKLTL